MVIAEIKTAQNVVIQYEVSLLRDRILAFIIDAIIITAVALVLSLIINLSFHYSIVEYIIMLVPGTFVVFYTLFSEVWMNGQTWGKRALRIKTVRLDGKEMGLSDHIMRWCFRVIDIYLSAGTIAMMMISSTEKNQRLGDILSNTIVIKLEPSLTLNIKDVLNIGLDQRYVPQYPHVTRLSEEDVLLIKTTVERLQKYNNEAHKRVVDELCTKLAFTLELKEIPSNKTELLKTLIKDYVILSR